jgi:hypothetical protein
VVESDRQIEDVARFDALLDDGWLAGDATGRLLEERAIRYNEARGRNERWVSRNDSDQVFGGSRVPAVRGSLGIRLRAIHTFAGT